MPQAARMENTADAKPGLRKDQYLLRNLLNFTKTLYSFHNVPVQLVPFLPTQYPVIIFPLIEAMQLYIPPDPVS